MLVAMLFDVRLPDEAARSLRGWYCHSTDEAFGVSGAGVREPAGEACEQRKNSARIGARMAQSARFTCRGAEGWLEPEAFEAARGPLRTHAECFDYARKSA
ncbi:hypothetical protein PUN4_130019 [Paraburkholderia unamae]|nr:hypothetical protein PUN4_130019 [Paraburkholderia unamae]